MSTLSIILVAAVVIIIIVGAFISKSRRNTRELVEYAKGHDFISEDDRIHAHVVDGVFDKVVVDGKEYDSMSAVFSDAPLSKDMHRQLRSMEKEMAKLKANYLDDMVIPKAYTAFKDTPVGDVRIYKEGPVSMSSRLTVIIGKDDEGNLVVGRAMMSKYNLLTDDYWIDFKLSKQDGTTEDEAKINSSIFREQLKNSRYMTDEQEYDRLLVHLALTNKHKFVVTRGQLVFDAATLVKPVQPKVEPVEVKTIKLPDSPVRKKHKQDELLIINGRSNK